MARSWLLREMRSVPGQVVATVVTALLIAAVLTAWAGVKEWDRLVLVLVFVGTATTIFVLVNNTLAIWGRYRALPPPAPPAPPTAEEFRRLLMQRFIDGGYIVAVAQWNPSEFAFSVTDVTGRYVLFYKWVGRDVLTLTTWRFLNADEKASVEQLPTARYEKAQRRMRVEMARFGTWFDFTTFGTYAISVDVSSLVEPYVLENLLNFVRRGHVLLYSLVDDLLDDAAEFGRQKTFAELLAAHRETTTESAGSEPASGLTPEGN